MRASLTSSSGLHSGIGIGKPRRFGGGRRTHRPRLGSGTLLVQTRTDRLRLITQHDHGLLSGELAHEWTGFGAEPAPLRHDAVLGTALHDYGWTELDREPLWDPETGLPHGFETHPSEQRGILYRSVPDRVAEISPWAGLLNGAHYARFRLAEAVRRELLARMEVWKTALGWSEEQEARLREEAAWLRLFDNLSLFLCLCGPWELNPPDWLDPAEIGKTPDGTRFSLAWADADEVRVTPFPWRRPLDLTVPARDLAPGPREYAAQLRADWNAAPRTLHRVRLVPGGSG